MVCTWAAAGDGMNLIEVAKVIRATAIAISGPGGRANCCGAAGTAPHNQDCAWLAWSQIIVALEAAERLVASDPRCDDHEEPREPYGDDAGAYRTVYVCGACEGRDDHECDCPLVALTVLMHPEQVPA